MSLLRRVWGFLRRRPVQPECRERRAFERILVRFAVAFAGEHKKGRGIARDLSLWGCMIETDAALPADTLLELKLFLTEQDMPIEAAASVRWADGKQMGVKFLRIRDEERLRKFLGVGEPQDAVQYPR